MLVRRAPYFALHMTHANRHRCPLDFAAFVAVGCILAVKVSTANAILVSRRYYIDDKPGFTMTILRYMIHKVAQCVRSTRRRGSAVDKAPKADDLAASPFLFPVSAGRWCYAAPPSNEAYLARATRNASFELDITAIYRAGVYTVSCKQDASASNHRPLYVAAIAFRAIGQHADMTQAHISLPDASLLADRYLLCTASVEHA